MKTLSLQSLPWQSPLDIYPQVSHLDAQLLYSGTDMGRYSFLPFDPIEVFSIRESTAPEDYKNMQQKFSAFQKQCDISNISNIPFIGGLCGVFSYEASQLFIDIDWKPRTINTDLAYFALYDCFFIFDHQDKKLFFASWNPDKNAPQLSTVGAHHCGHPVTSLSKPFTPEISKNNYQKAFDICQEEIEKGNSFQINFSQKFSAQTKSNSWDIFVAATKKNTAQMMYFLPEQPNFPAVISCSPERLFSLSNTGVIITQPIAGTRPRGKDKAQDKQLERELKNSPKEMAEHSMIVDLLRNDTGKVSAFGSVKVVDFARVEKYQTVMHLVSDIIGQKTKEASPFDIFEAFFPGGTITGTPKQETVQILDHLEISSRNIYCGSAGYFSVCGSADFNILIRTIEQTGKNISARAGGGLVYDASADNEYQECLDKFEGVKGIFI